MSNLGQTAPPSLTEGSPVTNLTVVVLLLIPCVVTLLLFNCLFLGYKLLVLTKRSRRNHRGDTEKMLLRSSLLRVGAFSPLQDGKTVYMYLSEPVLSHPVTSSRASSRDRAGVNPRFRQRRPDGATGSGSLRASAPNLLQSSGSETGLNLVPIKCMKIIILSLNSKIWTFCLPGVSLRILSADSDGLSNGVLSSALEWDYYDPCYVKQNNIPNHTHHRAVMHTKQYWV
uniref:Huluwa n=1 Tax=Nothobranchius furzeri TaxID=105023 RepID=A0A8C6NL63_NOTFU